MKKYWLFPLTLASLVLGSSSLWAQLPLETPSDSTSPAFEEFELNNAQPATLSLEDLPPGFEELPPYLAQMVQQQLELFSQKMGEDILESREFFAYLNPQTMQVVLGLTGELANADVIATFDDSLQEIQNPATQATTIKAIEKELATFPGLAIIDYETIPELNNLAETSSAMKVEIQLYGQAFSLDVVGFRRSDIGAFTAIIAPTGTDSTLKELATQLDQKIMLPNS